MSLSAYQYSRTLLTDGVYEGTRTSMLAYASSSLKSKLCACALTSNE